MKIIHTGDWHIGQSFYGYDRCDDAAAMLRQLADIVQREQPDGLLVSGDVFHTAMPSATAQRVYTDGMLALHAACPTMRIIVTAGNHDSPSRLGAYSRLWQLADTLVITDDGSASTPIPVGSGYVVALPFMLHRRAAEVLHDAVTAARAAHPNAPLVAMAHQAVTGVDINGHYRLADVALDYITLEADVNDAADYIALGHIHRPQWVDCTRARYSGSPLAIHFDEATYDHSVDIVTIDNAGATPQLRQAVITPPTPLLTVPDVPSSLDDALEQMRRLPADAPCYVRLNVYCDNGLLPYNAKELVLDTAASLTPELTPPNVRFCEFKITAPQREHSAGETLAVRTGEIATIDVTDIMNRYLGYSGKPSLTIDELSIINDILSNLEQQ